MKKNLYDLAIMTFLHRNYILSIRMISCNSLFQKICLLCCSGNWWAHVLRHPPLESGGLTDRGRLVTQPIFFNCLWSSMAMKDDRLRFSRYVFLYRDYIGNIRTISHDVYLQKFFPLCCSENRSTLALRHLLVASGGLTNRGQPNMITTPTISTPAESGGLMDWGRLITQPIFFNRFYRIANDLPWQWRRLFTI